MEADYVTLEDGTGLVHTAPGHGANDYITGMKEGLPIYCPVQEDGTFDTTAPDWLQGVSVWDANSLIVDRLTEAGVLFRSEDYLHSYPHDWRGKTPIIFRATEQWFVAVDKPFGDTQQSLRERALQAAGEGIQFVPDWAKNRLIGMLESRPDWCISRQRAWGPAHSCIFWTRGGAVADPRFDSSSGPALWNFRVGCVVPRRSSRVAGGLSTRGRPRPYPTR